MDKAFIKNPVEAYEKLKSENEMLLKDNKALCERIVKLEEEVEKLRTLVIEHEQRWLTSMGYYGVNKW